MKLPTVKLEYRSTQTQGYDYVAKDTGARRVGYTITHSFEAADGTVYSLRESVPAGLAQDDYKPSYTKGTVYTVELRAFEVDKQIVRGSVQSVELPIL